MGVALVPELDPQIAVEPTSVPNDERFEGGDAAELRAPYELGVVYRRKRFSVGRSRRLRVRHHYIVAHRGAKVP